MPELPEVETIRRDLRPLVAGRTITEAWVSPKAPRLVQLIPPDEFCRSLAGRTIQDVGRRGKYLLFELSPAAGGPASGGAGLTWIVHLRMTGSLQHHRSACPDGPHLRARFRLDNGASLCYVDLRKLGTMWLIDDPSLVVGKLGPEPLDEAFGPQDLRALLRGRSAPVKAVLLDQGALAGIGNIYADEALFAAKVRPRRAARTLSKGETQRLHAAIRRVLLEAMGNRGSSFRDYVDAAGREGEHHLYVKVFRRTGRPCLDCGTPIRRIKVGGRSTHFCPKCQR
ncbi:MAG TPA: bifunctional DNA-formamidopyrimidine glycosylase/DNA-(apurinic or apyrimidinic site) lyase [Dehalococcoidia bacterium]|nr:bifunctional DNA-formamidopyrimidine glycosylase/DNA-(apurinic or apyrimidinic site) lyase [Dehalococcoidia bacterium]